MYVGRTSVVASKWELNRLQLKLDADVSKGVLNVSLLITFFSTLCKKWLVKKSRLVWQLWDRGQVFFSDTEHYESLSFWNKVLVNMLVRVSRWHTDGGMARDEAFCLVHVEKGNQYSISIEWVLLYVKLHVLTWRRRFVGQWRSRCWRRGTASTWHWGPRR